MINGAPPTAPRLRRETRHLVVVYEPGSYAEQHADDVARKAEQALGGILSLLKIPGEALLRPHRITVVVGDTLPHVGADHTNGAYADGAIQFSGGTSDTDSTVSDLTTDVVSTVYTPTIQAPDLGEHLARVVVHRLAAAVPLEDRQNDATTGTAEAQSFFVDGAARFLAHQAVHGGSSQPPELAEAERLCLETAGRRKWRLPVYQAMVRGPEAVDEPAPFAAMQEAFTAYLIERDGISEFMRFL